MRNTKPRHISLNTLIKQLKEGHFVIPDFQRDFKWNPRDIRNLMRSIFLNYHIGNFFLWKGKKDNFKSLSCKTIYGFNDKTEQMSWGQGPKKPEHIILDGQQRLTALHYAFFAPDVSLPGIKNRAVYFIQVDEFMNKRYNEAFQHDLNQSRSNKIMNNPEFQYRQHIFPILAARADNGWGSSWVDGYEKYWKEIATEANAKQDMSEQESAERYSKNVHEFGRRIKSIVKEYQIACIELNEDLAIDKACDIFTQANTQTNSRGVQLDVFDIINALLKPKGLRLEHMCRKVWREEELKLSEIKEGKMKAYVLQTMSILLQDCCSAKDLYFLVPGQEKSTRDPKGNLKKEILILDTNSFKKHWDKAVSAIKSAIKMLKNPEEFGDISSKYFPPYVSILPVFAALQVKCRQLHPDLQSKAQCKIQHWYWASVFTNRYPKYSDSVELISARDFIDVTAWMESGNHEDEPALIQEFKNRDLDLHSKKRKGTSIYNGIFNLIILQGAKDWMDNNILLRQHEDLLNDHHIVPASWGKKNLNDPNSINTILNRTPLTVKTNHAIGNRPPNEYLSELIKEKSKAQVRDILASHFISPQALKILLRDPFTSNDYEEFINVRRGTILEAIKKLLNKKQLHL